MSDDRRMKLIIFLGTYLLMFLEDNKYICFCALCLSSLCTLITYTLCATWLFGYCSYVVIMSVLIGLKNDSFF